MRRTILLASTAAALLLPSLVLAAETITYGYDPRGRLVKVARSGTANNGVTACYAHDKADNRTSLTVASSDCSSAPPAAPSFSVDDVSASEGGSLIFTVSKAGSTSSSFSVNYASADGSAAAGSDYTAASGTLNFAPAQTSQTVSIATVDDTAAESAEAMLLNLSAATGDATISDAQGQGTINDNDTAGGSPSFSVDDVAVGEGGSLTFTVSKTGSTSSSFSISYASADGSALAGSDYTAASGSLTFAPSETVKSVTVSTIDDSAVEGAETLTLNLSGASGGATISDGQGVGAINDNDSAGGSPSFSISDATGFEGFSVVFTVTKTGTTSSSFSVNFATADGTATSVADYFAGSGTLTFAASETSKTIAVSTRNDLIIEDPETFSVNLSAASGGANISDSQSIGTIEDDDFSCPDPNTC